MKKFAIATAAVLLMTSSAFATVCQQRTVETENNASNLVTSLVSAGSSSIGRSHGYTGIPGQNGCPIKAAPGTCVDANKSLSDASFGGSLPVYKTEDLMNGDVPDYTQRRIGFQIGHIWIGTDWKGTAENPKSCS